MSCLLLLLSSFFAIICLPLRAFVLLRLWTWFVEPLGAPHIGMAHALGLSLLIQFTTTNLWHIEPDRDEDQQVKDNIIRCLVAVFATLITWGMGAIFHGLMQ